MNCGSWFVGHQILISRYLVINYIHLVHLYCTPSVLTTHQTQALVHSTKRRWYNTGNVNGVGCRQSMHANRQRADKDGVSCTTYHIYFLWCWAPSSPILQYTVPGASE